MSGKYLTLDNTAAAAEIISTSLETLTNDVEELQNNEVTYASSADVLALFGWTEDDVTD